MEWATLSLAVWSATILLGNAALLSNFNFCILWCNTRASFCIAFRLLFWLLVDSYSWFEYHCCTYLVVLCVGKERSWEWRRRGRRWRWWEERTVDSCSLCSRAWLIRWRRGRGWRSGINSLQAICCDVKSSRTTWPREQNFGLCLSLTSGLDFVLGLM